MKVLLISHILPGDADAGGARISWLFHGLSPFGVETRLLALRRPGANREAEEGMPSGSDAVRVIPVHERERPGYREAFFQGDGGFERVMVNHPCIRDAVAKGLETVDRFQPDLILSSTPSIRTCEVGCQLSRESGIRWIMDWRDPITLRPLQTWLSKGFYAALAERERTWVERAAGHVMTSPAYARAFSRHYPDANVSVVTNGWGATESTVDSDVRAGTLVYSGSAVAETYGFARRFPSQASRRIWHRATLGRLYYTPFASQVAYQPWGRRALWAISRCQSHFSALIFRGRKLSGEASRCLKGLSLLHKTEMLPWIPPEQARRDMARAQVLWLSLAGTSETEGVPVVSSKVFPYLNSGRPIFAVLPPACDTAAILRDQPGVFMPDPHDANALVDALETALSLPAERRFERDIDAYRYDRLAEKMAGVLAGALTWTGERSGIICP